MKLVSSRQHETDRDCEQIYDLLMEKCALTNDWPYAHVGELAFN